MTICNSHLAGLMNINQSNALVEIGNPNSSGGTCLGNTSTGAINISSSHQGVEIANNHLGSLSLSGNTGTANTVEGNTFSGKLACKPNHPPVTNNGHPNTGPVGYESGECIGV